MGGYKIISLISSSPNIAVTYDPTLTGKIMTILDDKQQCKEPLIYTVGKTRVDGDGESTLYYDIRSYTMEGVFVEKQLTDATLEGDTFDIATNKTQGFVIQTLDSIVPKNSAAGSVFVLLFNDPPSFFSWNKRMD
jgi:hypothetical protein